MDAWRLPDDEAELPEPGRLGTNDHLQSKRMNNDWSQLQASKPRRQSKGKWAKLNQGYSGERFLAIFLSATRKITKKNAAGPNHAALRFPTIWNINESEQLLAQIRSALR
ncbi:MAG TPA: hypothetical protein PL024_03030 [Thauera sp.]|nr:hypothetical protein [Thauera sp.]